MVLVKKGTEVTDNVGNTYKLGQKILVLKQGTQHKTKISALSITNYIQVKVTKEMVKKGTAQRNISNSTDSKELKCYYKEDQYRVHVKIIKTL